jgi:hypothetical protein
MLPISRLCGAEWQDYWSIIGMDLKGNGHELIKVLSYHLPEGTEENHDKRQP